MCKYFHLWLRNDLFMLMSMSMVEMSSEILELEQKAELKLIPEKSKEAYSKEYDRFMVWMQSKSVKDISEEVMLAYMTEKVIRIY